MDNLAVVGGHRLLPGVALSALGDGMSVVAIAWLALRLSHSAVLVGAARRSPSSTRASGRRRSD